MDKPTKVIEAVVIGGGISGLVTLKSLRQKGINCILCESKEHHGGLWHFSPSNYGVMEFTHINVSKYNYAFSDFPFPAGAVDYPHHSQMAEYIDQYVDNNRLYNHILYRTRVLHVSRYQDEEKDRKLWKLRCHSGASASEFDMYCRYLIIATGHHAKPKVPEFPGQSNFTGEIMHSVDYKDSKTHGFEDKNTVVVGIGNSAVDVAVNCAERKSKSGHGKVYLSTRSGAWVVPNYVFSVPTDLYASRFFLNWLPFPVKQFVFETILRLIHGSPQKWNLNPKMGALETQPTVSPTLIHHIQRGNIEVVPNIREICENSVRFQDGSVAQDIEVVVNCTGYTIDLPFLSDEIKELVLDTKTNDVNLFKNVFSPEIGSELAFIGFVQPSSGGVLPISEIQAQWLAMVIKGGATLPSVIGMKESIALERQACQGRFYKSSRHTIQKDPLVYNDEIASFIGAKPELTKHAAIAHRLLLGSGGVAQWTLQGPFQNDQAEYLVKQVPLPPFSVFMAVVLVLLILFIFSTVF